MDYIADNPYRILGVFANDPIRVRTANIARIRAFAKVGKECQFEADFINLLGPVRRDEESVARAISQLSVEDDAELYALFWIHHQPNLDTSAKAGIDIIRSGAGDTSYGCLVNGFVGALLAGNPCLSTEYAIKIFDAEDLNPSAITRALNVLENSAYVSSTSTVCKWWKPFKDAYASYDGCDCSLPVVRQYFNNVAIQSIYGYSRNGVISKCSSFPEVGRVRKEVSPIIEVAVETSNMQDGKPNAESQLALSEYADRMITKVQDLYNATRFWEARYVENIIDFIRAILVYAYSSKVRNKGEEFIANLEEDAKCLAPREMEAQSNGIREAIDAFCEKPDEIASANDLLHECLPFLKEIRKALGKDNVYYQTISARIVDNAVYACSEDFNALMQEHLNGMISDSTFSDALKSACQLCVDLNVLEISDLRILQKLESLSEKVMEQIGKLPSLRNRSFTPTISLLSDREILDNCVDYNSLKSFILDNPSSACIPEAKKRLWAIEDKALPLLGTSVPAYIKALFAYKATYPQSHNETRILSELNNFLLGRQYVGTIDDYNRMLSIWPDHPRANVIRGRIEYVTFKSCSTISDWEKYLQSFPDGIYRKEANEAIEAEHRKIELAQFQRCKTISDYKFFVIKYPQSPYKEEALRKIEDFDYRNAISTGNHQEYYKKHPGGRYVAELKKIDEDKADDKAFKQCVKEADYVKYLEKFPNGNHRTEVLAQIKKFKSHRMKRIISVVAVLAILIAVIVVLTNQKLSATSKDTHATDDESGLTITDTIIYGITNWQKAGYSHKPESFINLSYKKVFELYDAMKACGHHVGTLQQFIDEFTEAGEAGYANRSAVYNTFQEVGANLGSSYEQFMDWLLSEDGKQVSDIMADIQVPNQKNVDEEDNYQWDGELPSDRMEREMREAAANNRLITGARPYESQLGPAVSGDNYIKIKTSEGSDYIVLVKFADDGSHADHVYIRGGDTAKIYLPDGRYRIYFYSGMGWDPEKRKGHLRGGFMYAESLRKDKPLDLYSQYCEYTLYPVHDGNLNLKKATASEAF